MTEQRTALLQQLSEIEWLALAELTTPRLIQNYLDEIPYSEDHFYRCPLRVIHERKAHCFDGAIFAAAMLVVIGYPPLILEMLPNDRDDDHLLALIRRNGRWGAVGKSNFSGLRFRDPVFRSIRELVMSYFEQYYNVAGEKTLRGYTQPLDLTDFMENRWQIDDAILDLIADTLDRQRRSKILSSRMVEELTVVDDRSYRAGMLGVNEKGLFKVG